MEHVSGIYLITNLITQEKYVGQSIDVATRWQQHQNTAQNLKEQAKIYQAMREYYDSFHNGYNMTHGGQGSYGWKYDPEEIHALWDKGYNIKEIMKELGCSQQLVSERLKGYKDYNNETARARYMSYSTGTIYQYSLTGEFIQSFPNATVAAKQINNSRNDTILACLNGRINSAYGYQWRREYEEKILPVAAPHGKLVQCIETQEIFTSTVEAAKAYNLKTPRKVGFRFHYRFK